MRIVLQRVANARVEVKSSIVGQIEKGLLLLVGIHNSDKDDDIDYCIKKVLQLKLWSDDENNRWQKSVQEMDFEILCVSQFTLFADINKGNKPSFNNSMKSEYSLDFFNAFVQRLREALGKPDKVKTGAFGQYMQVFIQNDGPVTIEIDSRKFDYKTNQIQSDTTIK